MKIISIIPDTSVMFYLCYGSQRQKKRIEQVLEEFENIVINDFLKAEIGRVVFLTYFQEKKRILESLNDNNEFFNIHNQTISKQRGRKLQEKNRIYQIFSYIQDKFRKVDLQPDQRTIFEYSFFIIENELSNFQQRIMEMEYHNDYGCHQSNWSMIPTSEGEYTFESNFSCAKEECSCKGEILTNVYSKNKHYVDEILTNLFQICKEEQLDLDQKMYDALKELRDFVENGEDINLGKKICWAFGDFLISTLLIDNRVIFSANSKHFIPLLILKDKRASLIEFLIQPIQ